MWTRFMDMHSGGDLKESPYDYIYIEAPINEAKIIFYNKFHHNPERITCTCCGEDYSIYEHTTLEKATAYERNCKWDKKLNRYVEKPNEWISTKRHYKTVNQYKRNKNVLIIPKSKIKKSDKIGEVPEEGYVWK